MTGDDWRKVGEDWMAAIPDDLKIAETIRIESPYVSGEFVVEDIEEEERPDGTVVTSYTLNMLKPQAW